MEMNSFDIVLFNVVCIVSPLLLYLFYVAYNKKIEKSNCNLIFNMFLMTMLYLLIIFNNNINNEPIICAIILIVPTIIAYVKKDIIGISLLTISEILCFYNLFEFNIYVLLIEYFVYLIIYLMVDRKFIPSIIIFIHSLFVIVYMGYTNMIKIFIISFIVYVMYKFVALLMEKGEKILNYHLSIKEIEKEKQVRNSLFKIAHEIKNPMAVCKGYFDMMDMDNNEQVKKYIPIIKEEIEHTLIILQDFLSITKVNIQKEIMDINMLLEDVEDSFKPIFKNKHITSKLNVVDDDIYINGDYNRLKQVLINIIKNSMESISNDNGNINISAKINNDNYEVTIEDNGSGMSDETLKHLSEAFYTTKKNGTGLGIVLSKEILKQHNAKIEYSSKLNYGTTVLISFPIEKNAL